MYLLKSEGWVTARTHCLQRFWGWNPSWFRSRLKLYRQLSALMFIFSYTVFLWAARQRSVVASQFLGSSLGSGYCLCGAEHVVLVSICVFYGFPETCQWIGNSKTCVHGVLWWTLFPFSHSGCIPSSYPAFPGIGSRSTATLTRTSAYWRSWKDNHFPFLLPWKVVDQPRHVCALELWE